MSRARLTFFFATGIVILVTAFGLIKYASGYRPDFTGRRILPTGLLVAVSFPDGAQLWLNGKLQSATNSTLSLTPGDYEVEIKKDGYTSWKKKLKIVAEMVTKAEAYLFSLFPDLKALTFTGAAEPVLSPDEQRVVYSVSGASMSKNGLWVLDLSEIPLGFSREPRQIVQNPPAGGRARNFAKGEYSWSPDSKQILAKLKTPASPAGREAFVLDTDRLNPSTTLIDVSQSVAAIESRWQKEAELRHQAQLDKLPTPLTETLKDKVANIQFSPDESKILYLATASATLAAGTEIKPAKLYVYDLKEKENFYLMDKPTEKNPPKISWFSTSKHIFMVQKDKQSLPLSSGKISIMETDGQNKVDIWSGPFEDTFAFPYPSGNKILLLTAIGGKNTPANLYAVSLR